METKTIKKLLIPILFILMLAPIIVSAQSTPQANCTYVCNDLSTYKDDASFCESFNGKVSQPDPLGGSFACTDLVSSCGLYQKAVCCCNTLITDTTVYETPPKFEIPQPEIKLLKNGFSKVRCANNQDGSYYCDVPWIGEYIVGLYDYLLSIAGILATIVLMAGGLLWAVSGGDASKITKAKEVMGGAIIGLLLLLTAYLMLNWIGPNLTKFKPIRFGVLKEVFLINGSNSEENNIGGACPQETNLIDYTKINGLDLVSYASEPRLSKEAIQGLKKAVKIAKRENVTLKITSAFRTLEEQQRLYDKAVADYGKDEASKYVAKPNKNKCSAHLAGTTIDVCINGSASCGRMGAWKKTNASYTDDDVEKLKKIMMEAGWERYCGEWWHYQYNDTPKNSCSP